MGISMFFLAFAAIFLLSILTGCDDNTKSETTKTLVDLPSLTIEVRQSKDQQETNHSYLYFINKSDQPRVAKISVLVIDKRNGKHYTRDLTHHMYPQGSDHDSIPGEPGEDCEIEELVSLRVNPSIQRETDDEQDPLFRVYDSISAQASNCNQSIYDKPNTIHFVNGSDKDLSATCLYTVISTDKNERETPSQKTMTCHLFPFSERTISIDNNNRSVRIYKIDALTAKELAVRADVGTNKPVASP